MKFKQKGGKNFWAPLMPMAFALGLASCGDGKGPSDSGSGSGSASSASSSTEKGPTTGRLLDTAVEGVAFTASSGATGTTDKQGTFKYSHGDTVEFKLGSLVLGKPKGAAIITPMELAGESPARLQNILILLQSLDVDGNPDNGISIPASAAAAVTASINLESDPAAFSTSPELQKAREGGSVAGAAKTPEQAEAHFLSQGVKLLSTNIWAQYDDATASIIRASTAEGGEYLEGEATPDDSC
ncbi:MAG TPA: adhesin, partial [Nitrosospira sp.]|nr:adhesin [Nitrosospira sp.]